MDVFAYEMKQVGLPQEGVDDIKAMTEAACWHTVNLKAGVLIDAANDMNRYNDASSKLVEPNGGDFTATLADNIGWCLWYTSWETVDRAYDNEEGVIIHEHKKNVYCSKIY